MVKITISRNALEYILNRRMSRPNVIVYRKVIFAAPSAPGAFVFVPKVRVNEHEPSDMFCVVGNDHKIPIWVERGLLNNMRDESFVIALNDGLVKRLKIEKCPKQQKVNTEQVGGI